MIRASLPDEGQWSSGLGIALALRHDGIDSLKNMPLRGVLICLTRIIVHRPNRWRSTDSSGIEAFASPQCRYPRESFILLASTPPLVWARTDKVFRLLSAVLPSELPTYGEIPPGGGRSWIVVVE